MGSEAQSARSSAHFRFVQFVRVAYRLQGSGSSTYKLLRDDRFAEHGKKLALFLASGGWNASNFTNEIHHAFVLNGIASFLWDAESYITTQDSGYIREFLGSIAAELLNQSKRQEWGRAIRKRNAWNHTAIAFSGIGTAGLLVRQQHPDAARWREIGRERALLFFQDGITPAGMTREGLAYCGFVFRNLGVFLRGSREKDGWDYTSPTDNPYVERLRSIPRWYAADLFPKGAYLQAWNDSYWQPHSALCGFLSVFGELAAAIAVHVWNHLVGLDGDRSFGAHPHHSSLSESAKFVPDLSLPRPALFEPYFCLETGYAVDVVQNGSKVSKFSFNAGEYIGAIHDQADNNSFTLFLDDLPVIIDSGAVNFRQEGNGSSSFGHNSVVVDGKGQLPSGRGYGCSGMITELRIGERVSFLRGDATASYNALDYNPVRRAIRQCYFVKSEAPSVVVFDDFDKDGQDRDYEILLHTPCLREVSTDVSGGILSGNLEFEGITRQVRVRFLSPKLQQIKHQVVKGLVPFTEHDIWTFCFRDSQAAAIYVIGLDNGESPETLVTITGETAEIRLQWPSTRTSECFSFDRRPQERRSKLEIDPPY